MTAVSDENRNTVAKGKKSKAKRRAKQPEQVTRPSEPVYPLLCFDTETTNHGELLELSVFDIHGNEVYHRYFKPRASSWPTNIHHITPEMVKDCKRFSHHRDEIQQLLNSTRFLVGCALSNDLHTLKRYKVELHGSHTVFDIQNWYWMLHDESNRLEKQQTGLAVIADKYGLDFGEGHAHSATDDTRLTLDCFKALVADFEKRYNHDNSTERMFDVSETVENANEALKTLNNKYTTAYKRALQEYRMMNSSGFLNVVLREQQPDSYSFKTTRFQPADNDKIVLSVEVNDRVRAENDMRRHFENKQVKGYTGIYHLDSSDFEYIRKYRNSIDIETFIEREKQRQKAIRAAREVAARAIAAKKARAAVAVKPPIKPAKPAQTGKTNKNPKQRTARKAAGRALRSALKQVKN